MKLGSCVVPEQLAAAGEVQDFCVVNDPVDHRRGHCRVAEAGKHQGGVFIAG